MGLIFFSAALFPKCKMSGNGKERSHMAVCQTRTMGCPSLEGCCCGHSIPKHEVFKEEGWNLENRPSISDVQPQSSLILRGQCSQKNHPDPKLDTALESIRSFAWHFRATSKTFVFCKQEVTLSEEDIFSPFNSCMQSFYITPFCSILGLKSSFPSHKHRGECSCHPDIL